MANAVIGALRVVLGMDSAAFNDGVGEAQKRTAAFRKSMERTGKKLQSVGKKMSAGVTAPLVALAYKSVDAQKEQERAVASVTAALESMGDGAGYTLSQLEEMASKLQDKSLYGDEEILSKVTANLLTFGNVQEDVFARAQQSAVDLSARLGQDLQSSAVMLGKALNDPIKGLTALSRVGVSFTEQQKAQIKAMAEAGDIAAAQAMILTELEKQYSGQAEALAATDSGRITQAWNSIGDATERVGAIILPILADFADYVKGLAERFQALSPETQKFVVVGGALAAAIGPLVAALGLMMTALAPMAGAIAAIVSPLGLLAAGIAAAGVAIYQNWGTLKEDFPAITGAIEAAISGLSAAFSAILEFLPVVVEGMREHLGLLLQVVESLLSGDLQGVFDAVVGIFRNFADTALKVFETLFGDLSNSLNGGVAAINEFGAMLLAAMSELLTQVVAAAVNIGHEIINGLKLGIQEKWADIKEYIRELAMQLPEWIRKPLGIHSPSRVFKAIGGFIADGLSLGIADGEEGVRKATGQLVNAASIDGLAGSTKKLSKGFKDAGSAAQSAFGDLGSMLSGAIQGTQSLGDIASNVLGNLTNFFANQAVSGLSGVFSGLFGGGGGFFSSLFGGLMGFANGGSFNVGGAGGIDSQVVAFRASPNENVTITKPGQDMPSNGGGFVWNGNLNIQADSNEPQAIATETVEALRGMMTQIVDGRVSQAMRPGGVLDGRYQKAQGV